jgi:hypothetical protein
MDIGFGGKTKKCPKLPRVGVNREMRHSLTAGKKIILKKLSVLVY